MSRRSTFYSFIAAASATAVSALVYISARSNLAALGDVGEGTLQDIKSAVNARDFSFLTLCMLGVLTVILFIWFIALKRRDDFPVDAAGKACLQVLAPTVRCHRSPRR